jgi:hypothetical protein
MKNFTCILLFLIIAQLSKAQEVILFDKNGKFGLLNNKTKNVIVPAIYDDIKEIRWNTAKITLNNKVGIINSSNGTILVEPQYDEIADPWKNRGRSYWRVKAGNKYGFVDEKKTEIIPLLYDELQPGFKEGRNYAKLNGKCGFIDTLNKTVIPFLYEELGYAFTRNFENGVISAKSSGKWGVINKKGDVIVPFAFDSLMVFSSQNIAVWQGRKIGFYNYDGKELCKPLFDRIETSYTGRSYSILILNGAMITEEMLQKEYIKE